MTAASRAPAREVSYVRPQVQNTCVPQHALPRSKRERVTDEPVTLREITPRNEAAVRTLAADYGPRQRRSAGLLSLHPNNKASTGRKPRPLGSRERFVTVVADGGHRTPQRSRRTCRVSPNGFQVAAEVEQISQADDGPTAVGGVAPLTTSVPSQRAKTAMSWSASSSRRKNGRGSIEIPEADSHLSNSS